MSIHGVRVPGQQTVPAWSLVTVTYNNAVQLERHWRSAPPPEVEWIVVDNSSDDMSADIARGLGASQVVRLGRNCGFGFANNVGLGLARGEYVAFVNPDISVDYSTLPQLADVIDATGGIVAPQLVNLDGSLQPNGRGFPTLRNKILNRLGLRTSGYYLTASRGSRLVVCWAIGAAIAARRDFIQALGAWDDQFFIYYEDSDICLRAWRDGKSVEILGSVNWPHGWARATTSLRLKPWMHELTSMARFYRKYPNLLWSETRASNYYWRIAEQVGEARASAGGAGPAEAEIKSMADRE